MTEPSDFYRIIPNRRRHIDISEVLAPQATPQSAYNTDISSFDCSDEVFEYDSQVLKGK